MSTYIDDAQNDRIDDLEARLRSVEAAVIELGVMSKFVKYGVMLVAASLGLDITAVM
jgi:hypothetical protein